MLQHIWDAFCDAFNLGGLFDIIETIFYAVLIIIAIAIVVAIVLFVITCILNVKEEEKQEKEKAEKKRKDAEFFARRKKYYLEGLPSIYNKWSTADLKVIYGYLETIDHCDKVYDYYMNEYKGGYDPYFKENIDIRATAKEKLLVHLGHPKWKWMHSKGYEFIDHPGLITEDMNYINKLIQSRK